MIARVKTGTGGARSVGYIALSLHILADGSQLWRPVGDEAQGIAETSLTAAARTCIRSIDKRFQRLRADIAACVQSRPGSTDEARCDMLYSIEARAAGLHCEVVRLLDEPTDRDPVSVADLRSACPSPHQVRAGRVLAGLGLRDLAARTGLAFSTIQAIETGSTRRPRAATLEAVRAVLVAAGVEFDGAGWVRLRDGDAISGSGTTTP